MRLLACRTRASSDIPIRISVYSQYGIPSETIASYPGLLVFAVEAIVLLQASQSLVGRDSWESEGEAIPG